MRVLDQKVRRRKLTPAVKSSLQSLDLATEGRKIKFNDTVEVYYYPENMEQHDHHKQDSDEEEADDLNDLDYEESISCNEKLSCSETP